MKALVGAFNQEKALVGAFSVMVQLCRLIVYSTTKKRSEGEGQLLAGPGPPYVLRVLSGRDNV